MNPRPARRDSLRRAVATSVLIILGLDAAGPAGAAVVPTDFVDQLVVAGLNGPTNFDLLPDGRVLVVEQQTARIRLVVGDSLAAVDPVGTIADVEAIGPEQGLLGIAVDPRWPAPAYIYVFHNAASKPNLRLSRYELTGDLDGTGDGALTLVPSSRRDILSDIPDDYPLHNGGTILFGPDDMLYVATGEDGVPCTAQDIHQTRGKILRLNIMAVPAGPGPAPGYQLLAAPGNPWETDADPRARVVWQRGLRNPFSFDFDAVNGAIAIADVGSADYEELDVVDQGGHNFGWPLYEGPLRFDYPCAYADTGTITPPVYWYQRVSPEVEASIMMGACYQRPPGAQHAFPGTYSGSMFVYDFFEGALRRLVWNGSTLVLAPFVVGQPTFNAWAIGLFGSTRMRIGPDGGLWYFQNWSELRRIIYTGPPVGVEPIGPAVALSLRARPVPARGPVTLEWTSAEAGPVEVSIYDVAGRRVRGLVAVDSAEPGTGHAVWDGRDDGGRGVGPGVYLGVVRSGAQTATRRLLHLGAGGAP